MRVALLVLVTVFLFGCDGTTSADAGTGAHTGADTGASPDAASVPLLPDTIGPADRPAYLVVPNAHDGLTPLPVLVLLHGRTTNALAQDSFLQMSRATRRAGFYLLLPNGTLDSHDESFWNATPACCDRDGTGVDDSAYLMGLVDELAEIAPLSDIYFAGHSNGGFMSFRMACDHSSRVSAIVCLNGSDFLGEDDCVPDRPVSVLVIQGSLDESVPIDGDPGRHPGASEIAARWATRASCSGATDVGAPRDLLLDVEGAETTVERWVDGCVDAEVELWTMVGGTHAPPVTRDFSDQLLGWLATQAR